MPADATKVGLVGELEALRLVRREPDPDDGRATFAVITDAGVQAQRDAAPIYLDGIERHFTCHLTASEQRSIAKGLGRVAAAHEAARRVRVTSAR